MSTAYQPESDGQSDVANKTILGIVRAKLYEKGGSWLEKIPCVAQAIS